MDSDQPSSILHVRASTLYPLPDSCPALPFQLLCGEAVHHVGSSSEGLLTITNYRLYLQNGDRHSHVPLGLIENVEVRDMFYLHIGCKDARSYRCTFENNEQCSEWFRWLLHATAPPRQLEDLFAYCFKAWAAECGGEDVTARLEDENDFEKISFNNEVERLGFDLHGVWKISQANSKYRLCPSYPPLLLVPACITDETLEIVARFRSSRRIPAVVWRHGGNGAVIARCSQPEVGWLGWRSAEDEDLLKAIADACAFDKGPRTMVDGSGSDSQGSTPHTPTGSADSDRELASPRSEAKKVLIMDARSYTTAVANRARGGGCECPEYYPSCDIQFMNLANIHSIRKSFHALRQLCASSADQLTWWSLLEGTRWLQHMSGLMRAAVTLVTAVERDARPVLVHCSDGWDRTPQIVALAEILLDPFYRTIEGFRVLVEREWLAFGHKFADRCGHAAGSDDQNERCPVFLQWLDCVHQLLLQFPCSFQFAHTYLVKLAQHIYSNLFGTFLCNTKQEREERVSDRTFSVWKFLNAPCFKNHLYASPILGGQQVLWPACNVRDLELWTEVYVGSLEAAPSPESRSSATLSVEQNPSGTTLTNAPPMTKTRSYGDLMGAAEPCPSQVRRSSDPNIALDTMKLSSLSIELPQPEEDLLRQKHSDLPTEQDDSDLETSEIEVEQERLQNGHCYEDSQKINGYRSYEKTDEFLVKLKEDINQEIIQRYKAKSRSDINHNGELKLDDDSDNEKSESKSEVTLCASPFKNNAKSTETSTDTLVADNVLVPSEMAEQSGTGDVCKVCAQNRKLIGDKHYQHSRSTSGKTSRYSTPPLYSRTPSGIATTPSSCGRLDLDGLVPLKSDLQHRLWQIIEEHRMKEEALQRELHTTRMALIKQVCHNCSHNDSDRPDDTCGFGGGSSDAESRIELPKTSVDMNTECPNSLVGSVCSMGDGQASVGESLPSDLSWEALDDGPPPSDCSRILWVPDHAVTRCTGCQTEFWLGRRKHHCRNCGRIFCADCSENSTPLPSEHLYSPVRVCTFCYSQLRRSLPPMSVPDTTDKCKHGKAHSAPSAQQIVTATSN